MATAPKIEALAPVLQIDPDDILVGDRIGLFWPDKAAALGKLIAANGQRTPINVRKSGPKAKKPWTLVVGLHRLEGVKLEGLRAIDAIEVYGDAAELLDIQASENLHRRSLPPIERACFVRAIADAAEARLQGQHEGLTQQQIAIRARWETERAKAAGVVRDDDLNDAEADHTRCNLHRVYGWREEIADALDLSIDKVKRDLALHRAIVAPFPDLYEALARLPIADNASALRDIASYALEARRDLIEALIAAPDMTLAQAKEGLGLSTPSAPAATGATKFMNNATSNLARLSAGDQARIAPEIVKTMKPSALLALRAALDARIEEIEQAEAASSAAAAAKPVPALPIRQSVKPDHIACLECGEKMNMLKRHLMTAHQLTTDAYLTKWQLPRDYPFVAPNYAEERRRLARKIGLGTKGGDA